MSYPKTLLIMGLFGCFILTSSSLYRFLYNHVPVTREGKCLTVSLDGKEKYKIFVTKNHPVQGQCEVTLEMPVDGQKYYLPLSATYENLRDMDATRVDCNEKIN
jgi:hypothetical protein